MKIILCTKLYKPGVVQALEKIKKNVTIELLIDGEPTAKQIEEIRALTNCDFIISLLSSWIVPPEILSIPRFGGINFHPGPPEYPGFGCYNFALYDEVDSYGFTIHRMVEKIDAGQILAVKRFDVADIDSLEQLIDRTTTLIVDEFVKFMRKSTMKINNMGSSEEWARIPYTKKDFENLRLINFTMTNDEILRRIKALDYPGYPGAYCILAGKKFEVC